MNGKVKWYRTEKGYGFITGEDEKDYFLHYTSLPRDIEDIDGKAVTFEVKETDRGTQAIDVVFTDGASEESSNEASEE